MAESAKDFVVGALSALLAELGSYWIRSFWSEDKKTEYKERLRCQIRLARAIIHELPEGQAIKNEHLKAWRSGLIKAANKGDIALQSSKAKAKALEKALTKLEGLTRDAKTYLKLHRSEKRKEAVVKSLESALGLVGPWKETIESHGALSPAPAAPAAAGNPETVIVIGHIELRISKPPFIDRFPFHHICNRYEDYDYLNKKRRSQEYSFDFGMFETFKATESKKRRVLGDSLSEELENNSSWLDDTEWPALTYDDEPSINDRMKMKGKCPALSCSPSSSYGGANDHIPPSFPEENDE